MLQDVTLVLLAGPNSSRNGRSNTRQTDERALIRRRVDDLGAAFAAVIVCSRDARLAQGLGENVMTEKCPGSLPLAGIHAALGRCQTEWSFCLGLDMPLVTPGVARTLRAHVDDFQDVQVVLPLTSTGIRPTAALYSKGCREVMGRTLRSGERRIVAALAGLRLSIVQQKSFDSPDAFAAPDVGIDATAVRAHADPPR